MLNKYVAQALPRCVTQVLTTALLSVYFSLFLALNSKIQSPDVLYTLRLVSGRE